MPTQPGALLTNLALRLPLLLIGGAGALMCLLSGLQRRGAAAWWGLVGFTLFALRSLLSGLTPAFVELLYRRGGAVRAMGAWMSIWSLLDILVLAMAVACLAVALWLAMRRAAPLADV